jgi:hypothetical protein
MKKLIILFFITTASHAQVILSPYVVYIDQQQKFGSYIVQNESSEDYEINVSFVFGYTVSDSLGNITLKYIENPSDSVKSLVKWIRAFPRTFNLAPKERQVVRMTIRPPDSISAGTYWGRIVTSASPKQKAVETQTAGVSAQIKFVLNQVTTVLYRKEPANTGIIFHNFYTKTDSTHFNVFVDLERKGNSPFWCDVFIKVLDSNNNLIAENRNYGPIYFRLLKKFPVELSKMPKGNYKIEARIEFNEKEDIPDSNLEPIPPLFKTIFVDIN